LEAFSGRQRLLGDDPHSVEWSPGGYKRQASTRTGTASGTRSSGDHLSLSVQHFCQALSSAVCGPSEPSDPDEDQAAEVKRARTDGIFLPTDKWKESWDLIVLNLIIYSAVMVPYRICFNAPATGWLDKFEISLSLLFFVDVIFNFNTAYAEGDKWVVDRPSIALRYLQGWFWIDFPSCIPVGLIDSLFAGEQDELGMLRFLRLFRLLRLLKLLRLATIVAELEDRFDLNLCFLRIMQMLLALASVAICLVVVASVASGSKKLSVELLDASSESADEFAANKALHTGGTFQSVQHEMKKVPTAAQKIFKDAVAEQNVENQQEAAFRSGGNDAIDGDTTEFGGSASRAFTYTLNVEDADEAEE